MYFCKTGRNGNKERDRLNLIFQILSSYRLLFFVRSVSNLVMFPDDDIKLRKRYQIFIYSKSFL